MTLEELEAAREARRKAREEQRKAQRATDLEAITAIETEDGVELTLLDVLSPPGMPTLVALRDPTKPEITRYRARVRPKRQDDRPDTIAAAEEIGLSCLRYPPPGEVRDALLSALPNLQVLIGTTAIDRSHGKVIEEGKG